MKQCIYCKGHGPFNREHLLPRALGGSLTGDFVCASCNGALGQVDELLCNDLIVSMARVAFTPKSSFPVQLGGTQLHRGDDGAIRHLRVVNEFRPEIMPQIEIRSIEGNRVGIACFVGTLADRERLCSFLEKKHPEGYRRLRRRHGDVHAGGGARLVMHRSDDAFVSAATIEEADHMVTLLEVDGLRLVAGLRGAQGVEEQLIQPTVTMHLSHRPNEVARGVSKIALNLLAHTLGPLAVLHRSFDPIRSYILGELRLPVPTGGVPYDSRFVIFNHDKEDRWTPRDAMHAVVLGASESRYGAFVELYRSVSFTVLLGGKASAFFPPQCYSFAGDRQKSRALDASEFYEMLVQRGSLPRTQGR